MIRYVIFNQNYKCKRAKYTFFKGIKYRIKHEDENFYYTIFNGKLNKQYEHNLYKIEGKV